MHPLIIQPCSHIFILPCRVFHTLSSIPFHYCSHHSLFNPHAFIIIHPSFNSHAFTFISSTKHPFAVHNHSIPAPPHTLLQLSRLSISSLQPHIHPHALPSHFQLSTNLLTVIFPLLIIHPPINKHPLQPQGGIHSYTKRPQKFIHSLHHSIHSITQHTAQKQSLCVVPSFHIPAYIQTFLHHYTIIPSHIHSSIHLKP